jgi:hypothetical protein
MRKMKVKSGKIFKNMKKIERWFYYETYNATYNITAVVPAKAAAI